MTVPTFRALALGLAVLAAPLASLAGCDQYAYDANSYFPETWDEDYTLVGTCAKSAPHSGKYVTTWVNPEAAAAFNAGTVPYAVGTVFLKAQYNDAGCTDIAAWTAMRKGPSGTAAATGDWEWQMVDADGTVNFSGQNAGCSGCHSASQGSDFVATQPATP